MTNCHAFNKSRIFHLVLQNAGKCVSESTIFQNFLGGACPLTPLEGKALRALLTGDLGAGIVTVQIPPRAGVKVEM